MYKKTITRTQFQQIWLVDIFTYLYYSNSNKKKSLKRYGVRTFQTRSGSRFAFMWHKTDFRKSFFLYLWNALSSKQKREKVPAIFSK